MQTTPENTALLQELFERASIVADLDGPQLEAWVSGLFPVFDDDMSIRDFVVYCADTQTERGALLVAALAELCTGIDDATAELARHRLNAELLPVWANSVGTSDLSAAWAVTAPFGRSIVLGFDAPPTRPADVDADVDVEAGVDADAGDEEGSEDLRHSILIELDDDGKLGDLQLAGAPQDLLDEAKEAGDRVRIAELHLDDAVDAVVAAWPGDDTVVHELGPRMAANQQFVRRRMLVAAGELLKPVQVAEVQVDVQRGLDDREFADANRAALSTMQSAIGFPDEATVAAAPEDMVHCWASVVCGLAPELAPRERDALLWLEWADWLGAGIGLVRAGAGSTATGATLVDHVNRCPEVSSDISKADRDYAEWAFEVALDLLEDAGAVTEDRVLTDAGQQALWVGLVRAWSPQEQQ